MSDILKRVSAAMTAFTKIGRSNGSAPPYSNLNDYGIAYELMIAQRLAKAASARLEAAKEAAQDAGILAKSYKEGTHIVYNKEGLVVTIVKHKDSSTLDKTMISNYLSKMYGADVAEKAISEGSKPRAGNTLITVGVE